MSTRMSNSGGVIPLILVIGVLGSIVAAYVITHDRPPPAQTSTLSGIESTAR